MATNSNFNFTTNTSVTLELPFSEHIEELRQRIFLVFGIILILTCIAFVEVKDLVKILKINNKSMIMHVYDKALESNIGLNAIAQWTYSLNVERPQGLGTGMLFLNNFLSPLQINNGNLQYNPKEKWNLKI